MGTGAVLYGGRWDGLRVILSTLPARISVHGDIYERVDDPDTREFLGGYYCVFQ